MELTLLNIYGVILGKSGRHLNSSSHSPIRNKLFNPGKNRSVTKLDRPLRGKSLGSSTLGASYQQTHSLEYPRRKDTEV